MERLARTLLAVATLAAGGCAPMHYSVAVAASASHVTYAQRHHDNRANDYLLDCWVGPGGQRGACDIVELRGVE